MNGPLPFPFASLPALSRDELRTTARLRQLARTTIRPDRVADAFGDLVNESVTITLQRVRPLDAAQLPADGLGVVFSEADAVGLSRAALVDVEPALASNLVARGLKQRVPLITDPTRTTKVELVGALAALLHAGLRRAHANVALRVVAAGPAHALARDLAKAHERVATAWFTVLVGPDAFDARVSVPLTENPRPTSEALSEGGLLAMGEVPIAVPLVAAECLVERVTLAALRPDDALVLPSFSLRSRAGSLFGPVSLVSATAERGIAADLGDSGTLVLRSDRLETHSWDEKLTAPNGDPMSGEPNPTLAVLEDAPVVVRVELGTVEMKAREWASLSPGDVVTLGRKLGDPAILRASGVEVARGELVQVEGEYGVRILGRAGGRT